MAVDLHNKGSLLLPSMLYTCEEDNIFSVNYKPNSQNWSSSSSSSCFSSSDFGSFHSSPVESELGSTESESDQDDDYIAELTREMAHRMLQDDDSKHDKGWSLAGSPESELGSGLCPSQVREEAPMMGKFEKLKINEETHMHENRDKFSSASLSLTSFPLTIGNLNRPSVDEFHSKEAVVDEETRKHNNKDIFLSTALKRTPEPSTRRNLDCPDVEFLSKQALVDGQIRAIQFSKLKQEQIMKQQEESVYWGKKANGHEQNVRKQQLKQFQSKGRARGGFNNGQKVGRANLQQQQRTGSEMRAVFLGESGSRSGSCGTGVFLPRVVGSTSESRKKSGCSTVLIPVRVAQALKLHFDKMGVPSRSSGGSFPLQQDALVDDVKYGLQSQQQSQSRPVPTMNHYEDTSLPQEWTY